MKGAIRTISGRYFTFSRPQDYKFDIEEVGHSLSNICRYTGHVREFYSVAQHSVLVSYCVPEPDVKTAFGHDFGESVLGDVSSPLKAQLEDYKAREYVVEKEIARQFGLIFPHPPSVKSADLRVMLAEMRDLKDGYISADYPGLKPIDYPIRPMEPKMAFTYFMNRWEEILRKERDALNVRRPSN